MAIESAYRGQTTDTSPASSAFVITPHATNDLREVTRGIYVGTGGNVNLVTYRDETVAFASVPSGTILPVRAKKVLVSGTTASNLVGLV